LDERLGRLLSNITEDLDPAGAPSMATNDVHQGNLTLLEHRVAQELLRSTAPARLAYTWRDGSPRVVPIWFHWTGTKVVMASPPRAPKLKVLRAHPRVALTIDTDDAPWKVLLIRGRARVDMVEGIVPEYAAAARRYMGEDGGTAWLGQLAGMGVAQMARIAVTPDWVGLLDFQTRYPSAFGP
jgi:hypothetical protein